MKNYELMENVWFRLFVILIFTGLTTGKNMCFAQEQKLDAPYFTTLLVIGDDRSGSTGDIRKLTFEDYQLLAENIGAKGGGALGICLIGNPHPQSREPYVLSLAHLEKLTPYNPRDTKLTLTEKSRIKIFNEKVLKANHDILVSQPEMIRSFLNTKITPNILNYKPTGTDNTDIDDALKRINTLVNEPLYKNFDRIIVALVCDGKNQPGKHLVPVTAQLNHPKIELFLIGWDSSADCFKNAKYSMLSSKDALIEIIKNLK